MIYFKECTRSMNEPKQKIDLFRIAMLMKRKARNNGRKRKKLRRWRVHFIELLNEQSEYQLGKVAKAEGQSKKIMEEIVEAA